MRRISASISSGVTEGPNHHQRTIGRLSSGGAANDRRIAARPAVAGGWAGAGPPGPGAIAPRENPGRRRVTAAILPRRPPGSEIQLQARPGYARVAGGGG